MATESFSLNSSLEDFADPFLFAAAQRGQLDEVTDLLEYGSSTVTTCTAPP
jgi:hypothetical protein